MSERYQWDYIGPDPNDPSGEKWGYLDEEGRPMSDAVGAHGDKEWRERELARIAPDVQAHREHAFVGRQLERCHSCGEKEDHPNHTPAPDVQAHADTIRTIEEKVTEAEIDGSHATTAITVAEIRALLTHTQTLTERAEKNFDAFMGEAAKRGAAEAALAEALERPGAELGWDGATTALERAERRANDALELLRSIDYEEDSKLDRAVKALEGE